MWQADVDVVTERLRFSRWTADDHALLYALHSDLRVQQSYAPGPDKWTPAGIQRRLDDFRREQEENGFTKWKVTLADGTFVGRGGWSPWESGTLELGYAFLPEHWGRGYASEAARALVNWAAVHRGEVLVGFALTHNMPSRHILQKVGMEFVDYRVIAGVENAYYRLPQTTA